MRVNGRFISLANTMMLVFHFEKILFLIVRGLSNIFSFGNEDMFPFFLQLLLRSSKKLVTISMVKTLSLSRKVFQ